MNNPLKYAYFIGAGGIGMSALVRYFLSKGLEVHGYDRGATQLTNQLEAEGLVMHFNDDPNKIPEHFLKAKDEEVLWVYTPAIPPKHAELKYLQALGKPLQKRSEVLGMITANTYNIAIAGTHGKTTTTCMLSTIMAGMEIELYAFMGGISSDLGSNYFQRKGKQPAISICEADEFDRSFLKLNPNIAVITSMDADHLDIYQRQDQVEEAYLSFAHLLPSNGTLYFQNALKENMQDVKANSKAYGIEQGDAFITNIRPSVRGSVFDYQDENVVLKDVALGIPGHHNAENACVAIRIALDMGCEERIIRTALADFKGVKRRFDIIVQNDKHVFIDDYAHHPTEIKAVLESVKQIYPEKKLTAVFQPHLFSRTRDFHSEFAASLDLADEVLLMDIYPAREEPIPGVDSGIILNAMQKKAELIKREQLAKTISQLSPELLVTLGAGDIDLEIQSIKELLLSNE